MMKSLSVSLILPVRNESAYIEHSLRAILAQDYPGEMEILIADGMSTDDTREKIRSLANSVHGLRSTVTILDNPGKIVPSGMNIALRQAKGEIIIRVDGHCIVAPDYVRQCVEALQRTGADNAGGKMNSIGEKPFAKAVALATGTPFGIGGGRFHVSDEEEWVDTVYMGAWPRSVFNAIGLFDEELTRDQDDELNYRLREAGGKILLSPKIKSEYAVRGSPSSLWRQYYQYGFWKVRVLQKHPRQMSLRQFVPPIFVASLFGSALLLFFPFSSFIFHPSSFILILYLLVNLTVSIWTVITKTRAVPHSPLSVLYSLLLLPVIFAILHISYGLGFLVGFVKFWNRWGDKVGKAPVFASSKA